MLYQKKYGFKTCTKFWWNGNLIFYLSLWSEMRFLQSHAILTPSGFVAMKWKGWQFDLAIYIHSWVCALLFWLLYTMNLFKLK